MPIKRHFKTLSRAAAMLALGLFLSWPAIASHVPIYFDQGGSLLHVDSGGSVDVKGSLDFSTGTLKLAGSTVSASASELNQAAKASLMASDGLMKLGLARATYNISSAALGNLTPHGLGVTLPANAIVLGAAYQIKTQFVDAGSGTVALSCGSAAILSATDITGQTAESMHAGTIGALSGAADVGTSACELTATVAVASQSAGELILLVEYGVSE